MSRKLPYIMIAFAAAMWGLIGFFVKGLNNAGFSAMEIVAIRVLTAAIVLIFVGIAFYRSHLKIRTKDLYLFVGTGILSIVFFNWSYFTAIHLMNIPIAVALLYTSPAFVAVLSFLFLKESMNWKKWLAIIMTVIGCTLASGITGQGGTSFSVSSILIGLGAGFGYALYSIFGKVALRRYHPFTVTLYTFLVASAALVPTTGIVSKAADLFSGDAWLYALGLGIFPTVVAYFAYSWGLERTESSTAAVVATLEPVIATMLGILVYGDRLGGLQLLGAALILLSVIAINLSVPSRKKRQVTG
ncbi:DMT family transporter [Mesobacillus stamsii]|uniref:Drug/metabolite transporter (DMT)-like permease n=1 Tax=Mesobacillus stamsii TaxID=225347 RepID=A0ABU0FQX7_9BACI|nr:EamA family transporter [Mesobacillus stamsii]MDQ0412046.1 drug/metabolite transporter (DMT)-like permease [Mesobacillus stamsii]